MRFCIRDKSALPAAMPPMNAVNMMAKEYVLEPKTTAKKRVHAIS